MQNATRTGRRPCETCGALSPEGEYDVAIHDCDERRWDLITFTDKGGEAIGIPALRAGDEVIEL